MSKLKREVEKAKRTLSSQFTARLEIESFEGGNDYSFILTRAKFEELNLDLFSRTLEPVHQVLNQAKIGVEEVDDVSLYKSLYTYLNFYWRHSQIVLVGSSTRIPRVQEMLKEFFVGKLPRMGINPDEAVAYGAAIQGSVLSGASLAEDFILVDVSPLTLGIETTGAYVLPR